MLSSAHPELSLEEYATRDRYVSHLEARDFRVEPGVGDLETARAVARVLRIGTVVSEPDPNLYVDVSVLLGSAWTPVPVNEH